MKNNRQPKQKANNSLSSNGEKKIRNVNNPIIHESSNNIPISMRKTRN